MKIKLLLLLSSYLLFSNAYALSDEEYKNLLKSENFALADKKLGLVWKNLNSVLKDKGLETQSLLEEQRKWLKQGRDLAAQKLFNSAGDKASAYAMATLDRASELEGKIYELNKADTSSLNDWQKAYLKAAEDFIFKHKFPDGSVAYDYSDKFFNFANNSLAIADIDGDEKPEFLIRYDAFFTASYQEFVYGFKQGKIFNKFSEGYPETTYWSNGCLAVPVGHGSGKHADDFWAATYYKFNPNIGEYEELGFVDSWNEKVLAEREDTFPKEVDEVGDGNVYFIGNNEKPVDTPIYKAFIQNCIQNSKPVNPNWVKADNKGIRKLFFEE